MNTTGTIVEFTIGQNDISSIFRIPAKLYGRNTEVELLLDAFERVCCGSTEMVLIGGYSGIGKTSLVRAAQKQILKVKGSFISGKCGQYDCDIPYAPFIEASRVLTQQLLAESNEQISQWSTKIRAAVGDNGQVITDILPEIESVIGKQRPVPELPPTESRNRFNFVFRKFVRALASSDHPLTIFLDDIQWLDSSSLNLIELFLSDTQAKNLLLIGAYRDNEVDSSHPLMMALDRLKEKNCKLSAMILGSLDVTDIAQMVADTVQSDSDSVALLAELCLRKTQGNPFFLIQFLTTLHQQDLIIFDQEKDTWTWDLRAIEMAEITDNVVDMMIKRIRKLPTISRTALEVAAIIGTRFDLGLLSQCLDESSRQVSENLQLSIQERFITTAAGSSEGFQVNSSVAFPESDSNSYFEFSHDKFQQAAYSLMNEEQRAEIHLRLARLRCENLSQEEITADGFDIVSHFNQGRNSLNDPQEKIEVAELNRLVGRKAIASMAASTAMRCFQIGLDLLGDDGWEDNYSLTLELTCGLIESSYLVASYESAEILCTNAIEHVRGNLDRARIYSLMCYNLTLQNRMEETLAAGLEGLRVLGIRLSENPPDDNDTERFRCLGEMTEPDKLAAMSLLVKITSCALVTQSPQMGRLVYTMLDLTLHFGMCSNSPFGFVWFGCLLCWTGKDIPLGYQYGRLAVEVMEQLESRAIATTVRHQFNSFIRHWCEHEGNSIDEFPKVVQLGRETGDVEYGTYVAVNYVTNLLLVGQPLTGIQKKQRRFLDWVESTKFAFSVTYGSIFAQATQCLMGQGQSECLLQGDFLDEHKSIPEMEKAKNNLNLFAVYSAKAMTSFFGGCLTESADFARRANSFEAAIGGLLPVTQVPFYGALALLGMLAKGECTFTDIKQELDVYEEKLRAWAEHGPMNYQHKYDLLRAEKARNLGQILEAENFYENAINGAAENHYLHEEALALELAARFYNDRGMVRIAGTYFKESLRCYREWGAIPKVDRLLEETELAHLISKEQQDLPLSETGDEKAVGDYRSDSLDFLSLSKATISLSGEVLLPDLLKALMGIMLESSGAQKGCLVLKHEEDLFIEAEGSVGGDEPDSSPAIKLASESSAKQPASIIRYVSRTRQILVLGDALSEGDFTRDAYLVNSVAKSILCVPIVHLGNLIGVIFLENNLLPNVFSPDRLKIIEVLASQAGVSVENATLYASLEDRVAQRTKTLKASNLALKQSEERYRILIENAPEAIVVLDLESGNFVDVNENAEKLYKLSRQELLSKNPVDVSPPAQPNGRLSSEFAEMLQQAAEGKKPVFDWVHHDSDGTEIPCEIRLVRFPLKDRTLIQGSIIDMTERLRQEEDRLKLERQVQHVQKLESLGVLAGGIAHDFNNILMAVLGFADMTLSDLSPHSPVRGYVEEIVKGAQRAAGLAQQMLAYSGKGKFVIEPINIGIFVKEMAHLLEVSISKKAVLRFDLTPNLPVFNGDVTQIRQVIMNLITNASEAVGEQSGLITVSTGAMNCDRSYLDTVDSIFLFGSEEQLPEGVYIYFKVVDSGCGMTEETRMKLFEPFFTTKFAGRGLGMAAVQGIVRGHNGAMKISSELGKGTAFTVLFPADEIDGEVDVSIHEETGEDDWRGTGIILIADDEKSVCAVTKIMLERVGFTVLTVEDGRLAVEKFREHADEIVCVLLDLTMPHLNGDQVFAEIRQIKPGIRVVLSSGYNEQEATQCFTGMGLAGFIQKPYTSKDLTATVRGVLEG